MKRLMALLVFLMAALVPTVAGAGGWAVASLDPLPPVRAGEPVDVGFQLLQHGRTPVDATEWGGSTIGLGVRIDDQEGFVPATMVGGPGHFVARVDVPAGAAQLAVAVQMRNGLFVEERWIDVDVGGTAGSGDAAGSGWLPTWTVPLFALAAAACATVIVIDVRNGRRARSAAAVTRAA